VIGAVDEETVAVMRMLSQPLAEQSFDAPE
jgi:hypothetical protein